MRISVDHHTSRDEMGQHYVAITCDGPEHHHRGRIFPFHHGSHVIRAVGDSQPRVTAVGDLFYDELFLIDKDSDVTP